MMPTSLGHRARGVASRGGTWILIAILGYLVLSPLIRLQARALSDGAHGYRSAVDMRDADRVLLNTFALAFGSVAIALVLGTMLAWLSTRLPRRFEWLAVAPVLPIIAPAVATVTGWAILLSPRTGYLNSLLRTLPFIDGESGPIDIYTPTWIIIVTGFSLTSFVYLFVRAGLSNIHGELIEAAQAGGSSPRRAFLSVTLPLLRPVLVYGTFTALLLGLGQITAPLLLGTRNNVRVLTTELYRFTAESPLDYGAAAAIASPLLIMGVAVVLVQRLLLKNEGRFVTHGGRGLRRTDRPSKLAAVALALFGVVAAVLPICALAVVAVSPFYTGDIEPGKFTLANFRAIYSDDSVLSAIRNSVTIVVVAVTIALPIGFVVATVIRNSQGSRLHRILLDLLVNIPLGVPAVVIGAGFLFTYIEPPIVLYGTTWVVILVYVTLMLPFTTRMQLGGLAALGHAYEEASHASGAGTLRSKIEIVIPLMRPAIAGAGALMFVILSHEFSASVLVRSVDTQVMGTKLYDVWTFGSYPQMAALALTMCVVTGIGVALAVAVAGRDVVNRF